MAKNFGKSPITKRFDEVAKTTANTNITAIKLIEDSALIDYPNNGEDILYTADLENSINELGFTDPIEVTDYKMPDGQYMILSGHRRRVAGIKCGMTLFPCIIKSFENEADVQNYVLLANSQRDSEKDPLLYCRRYKLHEQHLKSINFQGSVREEIAKRLGISVQQADRYNQMNKIILPVWDLVRDGIVGMSSVLPMAVLSQEEQQDIFEILKRFVAEEIELSRERVKTIIDGYKNKDISESPHGEDFTEQENKIESENSDKKLNSGKDVIKSFKNFNKILSSNFEISNIKEAKNLLEEITSMFDIMLDKTYFVGRMYNIDVDVQKISENLLKKIKLAIGER